MSKNTIFYSWMDDGDSKLNRHFIHDCLVRAVKQLNREDVDTYVVVRDTQGIPGAIDICDEIFRKIDAAALVVADVSIVNSDQPAHLVSNPNVMFEFGYALAKKGDSALIAIANSALGPVEKLPFDIRARRILTYELRDLADRIAVRDKLVPQLVEAIRTCLGETGQQRVERLSAGVDALIELTIFASDLDEIEDGPLLAKNVSAILELARRAWHHLHGRVSRGFDVMVNDAIGKLHAAATIADTPENWGRIRSALKSACSDMRLGTWGFWETLNLDAASQRKSIESLWVLATWFSEAAARCQANRESPSSKDDLRELDDKTHDLRRIALHPLLPQHPAFVEKLRPISERARKSFLSLHRHKEHVGATIATFATLIGDELSQLLQAYDSVMTAHAG